MRGDGRPQLLPRLSPRTSMPRMSAKGNADLVNNPLQRSRPPTTPTVYVSFVGYRNRVIPMASPLDGCVGSLRSSMQLLDSSINILDEGVNDFPRLAKVLQTTRVSLVALEMLISAADYCSISN
jgi:hypothetical protein